MDMKIITIMLLMHMYVVNGTTITMTFKIQNFRQISPNKHTYDVYLESIIKCASLCSKQDLCCAASYKEVSSTCRIDTSGNCSFVTHLDIEWNIMRNQLYVPSSCSGCFRYASSTYKVIEDAVNWEMARDDCYNLGGKLVEMETQEENDFIKATLIVKNENITGSKIYFLGGFKFNANEYIRWISTPSQDMTFMDFGLGEPNNPTSELCIGNMNHYNFQWVDLPCDWLNPYICEFVY